MTHAGVALIDPYKIFEKIALCEGMRVADFGCGRTGHFVFPAAKIVGDKGVVYAVDVMKNVLESIRSMARSEGCDNVQIVWSDIELLGKTPIAEKSLDVGFFVNVIFQLKDRATAIKEAVRLLKKDGHLVIVDWAKNLGLLGPKSGQMARPDELKSIVRGEGLNLIDESLAGDYHYSLIFQKG